MGYAPLTAMAGAERKGTGRSLARALLRLSSRRPGILHAHHLPLPRGGSLPASTILLIDADAAVGRGASAPLLTAVGYTVTTDRRSGRGVRQGRRPPARDHRRRRGLTKTAFDVCREIRATPALAQVPILCVGQSDDVEDRIGFLEAGADDVMAKPFDDRELEARVEALLLRFQRSKDLTPSSRRTAIVVTRQRRTVAVHSPQGRRRDDDDRDERGDGQAREKPDRVVLVDLHLQFGQVATHLNLEAKQSLADVVRDDAAMREPELLRTYATRHDSGLHVLAAPTSPELAELVTAEHVDQILTTLLEGYDSSSSTPARGSTSGR